VKLYLIRHGIAVEREAGKDDSERPLTAKGREKTQQVAKRLLDLGVRFELAIASPLVRARQTAEIIQASGLSHQITSANYLAPDGDIQDWLNWWQQWQLSPPETSLALIGHQPDLGHWAEILVWGTAQSRLELKKAGIIGLDLPPLGSPVGNSQMFLLTAPKWLL
jgi:phosphohistidine phosphatase